MEKIVFDQENWINQELQNINLDKATEDNFWRLEEEVNWNNNSSYDNGWDRAGSESFMRIGSINQNPVLVEKSGNARKTLQRANLIESNGGNIIPTLMLVDESHLNSQTKISGKDYEIYQKFVPESFKEQYSLNLSNSALEDFAENLAALNNAGFRPTRIERLLTEMLCDGKHTYMVDFGSDIGSSGYDTPNIGPEIFEDFFSDEDYRLVQQTYRSNLP